MDDFAGWTNDAPVAAIGASLFLSAIAATLIGIWLRVRSAPRNNEDEDTNSHEGYVVSAVLGLLALLMGFTFSLAIDRFETRRVMVVEAANDIGTAYLRAQLL